MGFAKILIIYLAVSMALMIGTYSDDTGTYLRPTEMLSDFLGISGTNESMVVVKGEVLNDTINGTEFQIGGAQVTNVGQELGVIGIIWGFVTMLFDIWWIPVAVMIDVQAPFPLVLISAIFPIMFITYLYAFIRGGQA